MASITGKSHLFFVTSPRSPYKMRDEVKVLVENFGGQKWERNRQLQTEFYQRLAEEEFFTGTLTGELDFKARDRITRAPKSLGIVDLSPQIALTEAGEAYLYGPRPHEIFTRQLLKFQLPSPYHVDKGETFGVRPYLELFRLIDELDTLSKNEIAAFVTQLVHFQKYNEVKEKILAFREAVKRLDRRKTNYNRYFNQVFSEEILNIYAAQINAGDIQLRESRSSTLDKFIGAKKRNHLDYADAAIRYLRETRLLSLTSGRSNRLYIPDAKREEVKFLLRNTPRQPQNITDVNKFKAYLFDASQPLLYTDDQERLINAVLALSSEQSRQELAGLSLEELKNIKERLTRQTLNAALAEQINRLELYEEYDDIITTYQDITARQVFDAPLMLEWNTWRAFVMLDDGKIIGNFRFDDAGMPLSTAPGNQADIVCQYEDFDVLVEVTLTGGKRQYEAEGEPVARHVGNHQTQSDKATYCIFIAPKLSPATLAHFYILHRYETVYYGGKVRIVPLELSDFQTMLERAWRNAQKPTAVTLKNFVQKAVQLAQEAENEQVWHTNLRALTSNWI